MLSERNRAVLEAIQEIGGWCSSMAIRKALTDKGYQITPDQMGTAINRLMTIGRIDEPALIERREIELHEREQVQAQRRQAGYRGGGQYWLYRMRRAS